MINRMVIYLKRKNLQITISEDNKAPNIGSPVELSQNLSSHQIWTHLFLIYLPLPSLFLPFFGFLLFFFDLLLPVLFLSFSSSTLIIPFSQVCVKSHCNQLCHKAQNGSPKSSSSLNFSAAVPSPNWNITFLIWFQNLPGSSPGSPSTSSIQWDQRWW